MPSFPERLRRGEQVHKCTEDLLAIKWKDKRDVFMITTVHTADMISTSKIDAKTQREIMKPKCIKEYNQNMGAVDKVDMQISFPSV